jgi:2-polyprenyl-3-methyl-5-hydroxy-6-metoxy-1,4-benzoquinol methylase
MSSEKPVADLEQKLTELIELRKKAEADYGKLLTILDEKSEFTLPQESAPRLNEIKESLNHSWDLVSQAYSGLQKEKRFFWKDVARNLTEYLDPLIKQQREFNSLVVHMLNDFTGPVQDSLASIREFHNKLILYFQQIIPVVDTKSRETIGIEDKNVALNLAEFQETMTDHTQKQMEKQRNMLDILLAEFGKKMESLQGDNRENATAMQSMQTSLRSLHHLANALQQPASKPVDASANRDHRYYHFEEAFRGDRAVIKDRFAGYVKHFKNSGAGEGKVLDLGCGRGEFLELLKEASVPAFGVDSNPAMVKSCRDLALNVTQGDLLQFLEAQKTNSLAGIFCSQVVEHLPPDVVFRMIEDAHTRIRPGGVLLLETVNVASAFGFLQVYTKDLTHRTPIHPETLKFVVAAAGFTNPQILLTSPVPAVTQLKLFPNAKDESERVFNENMSKLNKLLFDPQEYAVLATK